VPPGAPTASKRLRIDLAVPGRHSTGLYAAPGAVIRCRLAAEPAKGLRLRIGAHSDNIDRRGKWPRMPRGVPTSAEARAALADLPAWMPDDWPAAK
jgi:hypothetical protein